VALTFNLLK